jgi:hypothetical protein
LSRSMTTLNPVEWLPQAVQMMRQALTYKFCQDETLFKLLLETGTAYMIYASPEDAYWGIGCTDQQALTGQIHPQQWGQNMLGNLLMELRNKLRVEGRPDWGHIMAAVPEPSLTRKRPSAEISTELPVAVSVIKIDEQPLPPVQEQIAIIEDKGKAEETEAAAETTPDAAAPNKLMELFGK